MNNDNSKIVSIRFLKSFFIIISILFITFVIFTIDITSLINFAHDDSFYYLKTAFNFSTGNGSSFDTINPTNGYHPLYFWILSLYFFIINLFVNTSPELLFRFVCVLHLIIVIIIIYLISEIIRICYDKNFSKNNKYSNIITYSVLFGTILIRDIGTESQLTVLLLLILYFLVLKKNNFNFSYKLILGFVISLLLLSRTDLLYVFFIPLMIFYTYRKGVTDLFKKYFIIFIFVLVAVIINISYNYLVDGSIFSVSHLIVNSFPQILLLENIKSLYTETGSYISFLKLLMLLFLFIVSLFIYSKQKSTIRFDRCFLFSTLLAIGSLLFCFQHLAFNKFGLRSWYMAIPSICIVLLIINIFQKVRIKKTYLKYLMFVTVVIISIYFLIIRVFNNKFMYVYLYSKEIEKITDVNDRIFQIDFSGIAGFFSSRKIINGDGLINSMEYYRYLKGNDVSKFLKEKNVKYYSFYVYKNYQEDDEYIYDYSFKDFSNGIFFKIRKKDIILKFIYHYEYLLENNIGNWYLVKLNL